MPFTYTIKNQYGQYFITCTVHQWVDVFAREAYKEIVLYSLRYYPRWYSGEGRGVLQQCEGYYE